MKVAQVSEIDHTEGFAQQASQINPDTTVSNILEDTDSDAAVQLGAPVECLDATNRRDALNGVSAVRH